MAITGLQIIAAESDEDLRALLAVRNAVHTSGPLGEDELRHNRATATQRVDLLARLDGAAVGAAVVSVQPGAEDSDHAFCGIWVLAGRRRRGVGSALLAALSAHARGWGTRGLDVAVHESSDEGRAFAEGRGFREVARQLTVALELRGLTPPAVDPPAGIEITTLALRPDLDRQVWEVERESRPDIPGPEPHEPPPFEEWRDRELRHPAIRPEGCFLALEDGLVVGYAMLSFPALRPGVADHAMTAVRRSHRGRGIAGALKRAQIAWASTAGIDVLETENEERNAPIRRLNARLGYRPRPAWVMFRGPLAG